MAVYFLCGLFCGMFFGLITGAWYIRRILESAESGNAPHIERIVLNDKPDETEDEQAEEARKKAEEQAKKQFEGLLSIITYDGKPKRGKDEV